MRRILLAAGLMLAATNTSTAQSWVPWSQLGMTPERPRAGPASPTRPSEAGRASRQERAPARESPAPQSSSSGPASVSVRTGHGAGTIVIDTSARRLYLMQGSGRALAYPISVGRDGFDWTGTKTITQIKSWPDWRPPAEMRARQPNLPEFVPGGPGNPLGAKALYLGSSLYRIHGTDSPRSVGQANSSGCFRMTNSNVEDLARRVGVGTKVVVKSRL